MAKAKQSNSDNNKGKEPKDLPQGRARRSSLSHKVDNYKFYLFSI